MWKVILSIILLSVVSNQTVYADTTQTTSVTCEDIVWKPVTAQDNPVEGDTTTTKTTTRVCTTSVVTTVTTPESTTTTTSISENLTDSGNILSNSQFVNPAANNNNFSSEGWTVSNGTGAHNANPNLPSGSNTPTVGGAIASEDDTVISQTITSVKTKTGMSDAEIKNGFRSTLKANIWFWNSRTNVVTLKQIITDNAGNTTTQTRVITDTGCSGSNCGQWVDYDDTYIQGTNTATDFSIKAEVSNDTSNYTGSAHLGPDIDDIELNIKHNEITTTTQTTAATSSSSTATSVESTVSQVVEVEYCWQKTPSTCANDQPGVDDIEEDIVEAVENLEVEQAVEEVTEIEVVNLNVEEITIIDVTMDEAMDMELTFEPEQTFEEAFTSVIEEAGMEEEFSDALAEEDLTEEEFFSEVEDVMAEEMDTPTEVTVEATPVVEEAPVVEETPVEETPTVEEEAPVVEEEATAETETEPTVEEETPAETETETEPTVEEETPAETETEIEEEVETETDTEIETEEETETETEAETETDEVEESESDVEEPTETGDSSVEETEVEEVEEVEVTDAQVEEIQAKIERVIAKIEANLTRIDLKLKATSFVLAKAMIDSQPDMTEYTSQVLYDPTTLPDNNDWYAESTLLDEYGDTVYQDVTLGEYVANDPMEVYEEEINTNNNNISRLEAELEELENELNE